MDVIGGSYGVIDHHHQQQQQAGASNDIRMENGGDVPNKRPRVGPGTSQNWAT